MLLPFVYQILIAQSKASILAKGFSLENISAGKSSKVTRQILHISKKY